MNRFFAYDVVLFKLYITTAINPTVINILPQSIKDSITLLTAQYSGKILEEQRLIEDIYNIDDMLAFISEICCSFAEEIFVVQHIIG
jgi:hypothetical protein